jgi:hypothetical protein
LRQQGKESQVALEFEDGKLEVHEDGMITADGASAVNIYRLSTLRVMLEMEIRSGLRMSRGVTALASAEFIAGTKFGRGNSGRTKALAWVEAEIERVRSTAV